MYRFQREDQFLGLMETTFVDAPAASPGEQVKQNDTTFTIVQTGAGVDHIWWKKGDDALLGLEHAGVPALAGGVAGRGHLDGVGPVGSMRVLLSPRAAGVPSARAAAERLAVEGDVISLLERGVANLERRLTSAEVDLVRRALTGAASGEPLARPAPGGVVGYVCVGGRLAGRGSATPGPAAGRETAGHALVAVGDHANLSWRSPLWGPEDEALGERFPVTAGLYRPDVVRAALGCCPAPAGESGARVSAVEQGTVATEVVAGVGAHGRVTEFVRGMMGTQGWTAWSAELVPVALVAAHLGLGVAGVVVATTAFLNDAAEGEDGS